MFSNILIPFKSFSFVPTMWHHWCFCCLSVPTKKWRPLQITFIDSNILEFIITTAFYKRWAVVFTPRHPQKFENTPPEIRKIVVEKWFIFKSCIKLQKYRKMDKYLVKNQFSFEIFVCKFKIFLKNFES